MKTDEYEIKDLFLAAIKAEMESQDIYGSMSDRAQSNMVKDRFTFLAREEERHERFLRRNLKAIRPDEEIVVPETTEVPLPSLRYDTQMTPIEVLEGALEAETAAEEFYRSMAKRFESDGDLDRARQLNVLANMERSHFELIRLELDNLRSVDTAEGYWEIYESFEGFDDEEFDSAL